MHPSHLRFRHLWVIALAMWLAGSTGAVLLGADSGAPTTAIASTGGESSKLMQETRQYLARLTEERNQLRERTETLESRQGLLLIYAFITTLLGGWLVFRALRATSPGKPGFHTDTFAFADGDNGRETTVTMRKNATITIRNSTTQQAEVVEQVQTRRQLSRDDASGSRGGSRIVRRVATDRVTNAATATEPTQATAPMVDTPDHHRPATVRVAQHADRLVPVEAVMKPGTGSVTRTSGNAAGS